MTLFLYRVLGVIGAPLLHLYLARRRKRGKEDRARIGERLGRAGVERPPGALVWIHAASIGESLSLLPLVESLREDRPGINVLITTGTVTSAMLMEERLPASVIHQYIPVDRLPYVQRFFDHWRPDLVLWAESEFWPNLVSEPARRGVPLILINGRVSPRSFVGWKRFPGLIAKLLSGFSSCLAQTEADAERLRELGAANVDCVGNLKFAVPPLPADTEELARLRAKCGKRPLWLAASTHPGEEMMLWEVHRELSGAFPDLLTIIVPRHPERGAAIKGALERVGARVRRRAAHETIEEDTQVYLADTLGELGLFYRLAGIVFMGKSFVDLGGQNLLEPAKLECAILHGPYMWNFEEIVARMKELETAVEVADGNELKSRLERLLEDKTECGRLAAAAMGYAESEAGVTGRILDRLASYLDTLPDGGKTDAGA